MIKTIELKGSYSEIGEQWGHLMKPEIDTAIKLEIDGTAKFFGIDRQVLIQTALKLLPAAESFDPEFLAVIKGMAKGSDNSFEEMFTLRSLLEVLFYLEKLTTPMCSSLAVANDLTRDGKTIIAQNIDWHSGHKFALLKITWPTGVRQLALCMGGMWEYPLTIPENGVPFGIAANLTVSMIPDQNVITPPISVVMNKASRQKRLEQALNVMVNAKINMCGFILASAEGDLIGIEHAANTYEILYPENRMLMRANHYLADRFRPMEFFAPFAPDSYLRYARLKHLMEKQKNDFSPETIMTFLADHHNHPKGICTHVDPDSPYPPAETLSSVIMVPESHEYWISNGLPCKGDYIKFKLD